MKVNDWFFRADISYLKVCSNGQIFDLGVFALKKDCRMPMHNHHGMYGVVKVLFGSGRIQSFSPIRETQEHFSIDDIVDAEIVEDMSVSAKEGSNLMHLEPNSGNIHAITADKNSPLVFLDLLMPPYDHLNYTVSYFELVSTGECRKKCKLKVIPEPTDYRCDQLDYAAVVQDNPSFEN